MSLLIRKPLLLPDDDTRIKDAIPTIKKIIGDVVRDSYVTFRKARRRMENTPQASHPFLKNT
jgi:hypothetical protein